jgi:hypothetical protein
MERHPTDFAELLFGLAFFATGAGFIVHQTTNRNFDPSWIAAIALVAVGCAFLAVTVLHRPRVDAVEAPLEPVAAPSEPSQSQAQSDWPSNS